MADQAAPTGDAWVFPHGVTGISGHALFRYRDRIDRRCSDPIAAVIRDLERGVPRRTAPRWAHMDSRPVEFYIAVGADDRGPARAYPVRDGLVITTLVRPAGRPKSHRRSSRPQR